VPFRGGTLRVVAEGVVEALEVGEIRNVLDEGLDPRVERRLLGLAPSASRRSIPRAISARALMMCATSLRVLLMLNWTSTLLRDVLLIWMSCSLASSPLNCVPS